ncbi:hypothetical protein GNF10_23400 [Nostoc sp. UCD121]|uniref:hypothetical protein n=1 Tax=unclassified Nostoc TaxID=2593658 RepID=UPI001626CFFF|nr:MULTISPECIES: hypothetical protein [unclassified Nostoc]MBC1224384.1 hypothetical protein [Nostoc sp. UCD120]MBC1278831.1 hypothetical protein [Nostoc sp. UCD121]MBC1295045.1 hypothetical protein [Nostoc sp. UCD122]
MSQSKKFAHHKKASDICVLIKSTTAFEKLEIKANQSGQLSTQRSSGLGCKIKRSHIFIFAVSLLNCLALSFAQPLVKNRPGGEFRGLESNPQNFSASTQISSIKNIQF